MKKSNAWMVAILLAGSMTFYGCSGEDKTEEETTTEMEGMEELAPVKERASPLRTTSGNVGDNVSLSVQYGAPSIKGRVLWGDLVPYNSVWRTGANEATFVEFASDIMVEGSSLPAGKYSLFTIPNASGKWTVIFNSDWDLEHGHFQYDDKLDVLRVESTPTWVEESQEQLSVSVETPGIVVKWGKLVLPIVIG